MLNTQILLNTAVLHYNQPNFINTDPISVPHRFTLLQDREIMGFWAAMLAWGQRKTIIDKSLTLANLMDNAPYDFVRNHTANDLKPFLNFKHRTFNATDALYFIAFFSDYYKKNTSLETAFSQFLLPQSKTIEPALIGFHNLFFSLPDSPARTRKHISTPARRAACKRLCMFLRWMVRRDNHGVDFGLWQQINASQLLCPLDVDVVRVALKLNLLNPPKSNWQAVLELTQNLRQFDPTDPVKYDFALFGLSINNEII